MTKLTRYLPALLVAGAAITTTACASGIYDDGYRRGTAYPVYRGPSRAAEIGYRDGIEAGRDDARHRERFDPVRARRYRSADHDYDRRYGSRDEYAREYRANFERGYRNGYEGARRY
jgi:hypothetical protein